MEHALRSCLLAVRLGEALGLADEKLADAYYLALLRYVGCNAERHVEAAVFGDEIAARAWRAGLDLGQPDQLLAGIERHVGAAPTCWSASPMPYSPTPPHRKSATPAPRSPRCVREISGSE